MTCICLDVLFVLTVAFLTLWIYFKHSYRYWEKKKVPYLKPTFPYGNNKTIFIKSSVFTSEVKDWYDELKRQGHKYGGVWSFSRKVLVLVDPEYIKDVLTKDFHFFVNRDVYCNEKHDPQGTHLFNIRQSGWKVLRQKLTPTFTSGKMKMMFNSVVECSHDMIDFMKKSVEAGHDIDIREVMASFTTDVIGNVAFGVESNSFDNPQNEIRQNGRQIFNKPSLKIVLIRSFPELAKSLGGGVMRQDMKEFFGELVKSTMDYRRKNNISRPDFLQLLIDMNKQSENSEKFVNFDQIVANTILFFIAGFDTSSTTMTFTLYELARNPELQDKTRVEIVNVLNKHEGKISYESLQEMTYLQQVIDEAMRIWPPVLSLGRICTKDYKLRNTDIIIEMGTSIVISTLALGRDPEYFPDPEKFDPERFSPEEKAKLHPYVHIPFGEGPRNCIGLRFGLMQSKIGIVSILTDFRLTISHSTKMPLTVDPTVFLLKSNETLYLKAEKI